jgi:hypothetical protein
MSYSNDFERYTIVTAFYLMKSKFHPDKYKEWILNFIKLKINCVLFTNQITKEWLETWMDMSKIHLEILEMDNFITAKYDWMKQYEMDNEKDRNHSRELYMIWNEKINFLKLANGKNPYQTEWFLWCDIGSLRQEIFSSEDFTQSIVFKDLEKKTYFFRLYDRYYHNPYFMKDINKYLCKKCDLNVIQGGFILVHSDTCHSVHQEYYQLLDKLYEMGLFIGKDQCCYLSLVLQSKHIKVLEINNHSYIKIFNDVWFFVYPFMLGCANYRMIQY